MELNDEVRAYWEAETCGTSPHVTQGAVPYSAAWFANIEEHRYRKEPIIHAAAQFTRCHGKKMLEVGVGAGTDHLQWARAGAECHGVDLTDAAIDTTRRHLDHYGFSSDLRRIDAESLPFDDGTFDLVYSWGVIHHSEQPETIVGEIHRVLKPGGRFIGMMYHRYSLLGFKVWLKHALLKGKPWRTLSSTIWRHMESVGTKAYSRREIRRMFAGFSECSVKPWLTPYDTGRLPRFVARFVPDVFGWFLVLRGKK